MLISTCQVQRTDVAAAPSGVFAVIMALLSPTFVFGILVLLYLSTFVLFAVLRILTGISIQRVGYFSLRRLAYTPRDGFKIEIRGLGLNVHRPTFAQPTWLSVVVNELVVTLDIQQLDGHKAGDEASSDEGGGDGHVADASSEEPTKSNPPRRAPSLRRNGSSNARSETWKHLTKLKDRIKRLHRNVNWLRMVDVVATNSTINVVDVGNIQFGAVTVAVDTRRKMVDRARFFFQARTNRARQKRQAEWIMTMRSVLFTPEGQEALEVLDSAALNVHGFLYEQLDGLRDASIALKLGRVHVPYDDILLCAERYKALKKLPLATPGLDEPVDVFVGKVVQELDEPGSTDEDLMKTVSDSKEFVSSTLRGIKEVQFAVSFAGLTKKIESVKPNATAMLLNASMKEVGVDLHRLDPKSPAHRMYFPSKDVAHEALAAALSISVGLDDGQGKPERLIYIPMATTTVRTTLPSKTVELARDGSAEERNANILFANSVVTSPSVDLDPRHLPLLIAMLRPRPKAHRVQPRQRHALISRLLPKANIKFSMHEPVIRIALPPVHPAAEADDFDMIISSISSISLDVESFHSAVEDLHYSLGGTMRLQSHHLYYQTFSGSRFDLIETESFDLKVNLSASPDVQVAATGNLQTFAIKMVRPEITDGLRQIVRQLRLNVEPDKKAGTKTATSRNFLRAIPAWLVHFQIQASDFSAEVAGVDEDISDDTRGVSIQLDSLTAEYREKRLEGLQRRPSRRRTGSRSLTPDADLLKSPPSSPKKKQQNSGDGRRIAIHVRGLEAYIVEASDKVEVEPFASMPRFEVAFTTLSDNQGPLFHIHGSVRTILLQYSLYRHYSVGVATMVLRKAFMRTGKDLARHRSATPPSSGPETDYLLATPPGESSAAVPELVTVDLRCSLVQIKSDMPNDPPMMLQIYGMEAGRHRWSPPFLISKLIRLYVEAPRMRSVWARIVSIKQGRLDYRTSRRKLVSGSYAIDRSFDISSEAIRVAIPHEVVVYKITDNCINVFKSVQQLHHRFKTGTNEYILDKKPEGPKNVPKITLRARTLLFEIEDGAFEWKLGMIYRAGRIEQMQRLAREEAFQVKMKKVREEDSRKDGNKFRARSLFQKGRANNSHSSWTRSQSADGHHGGADGERGRGRSLRYDPEAGGSGLSGTSKVPEEEARDRLDQYNAKSWKRRIDRFYELGRSGVKEIRGLFWGPDHLPDDLEDTENVLEVPQRPALMSALVTDLQFTIDKPTFPMKDLADFLHKVGKGMPRDMQYGLLVPMHVRIDMGEARVSLRDYPLPLLHVPSLKSFQSSRHSLSLKTNFVIAEEFRGIESTRKVKVNIIPPRNPDPGASNDGCFAIDVRRTIGPVKSYSDMFIDINTALPTRITWGPCYQPVIQDMMMVIESFTKPQIDPSDRVGFWDKIRLNFHSRIHIQWKGDGDMHLALKGTRDPYLVTGNGAGFLMCWRNDVRWHINAEEDPKRLMTVDSGEYLLAIPDYSHQVREASRRAGENDSLMSEDIYNKSGASFRKVVMKLSGKVQWMAGLVFEQAIVDGRRNFGFRPHYDVVLKSPLYAKAQDDLPYDALRGFRSQHIHLSIAVRAPVDRDWMSSSPEPSRSYNAVHWTPRFFTHFFAWWSLFGGPLSLPIRQGSLWPGREKSSKKFGRHLATVKYNLLLAPLFLSHIYRHKDAEDLSDNAMSATGIKVRFDSFKLDLHQRREEFNTRDRGRKTQSRTSGIKIHAAQLDLESADLRAISASIRSPADEAVRKASMSALAADHEEDGVGADLSRFTIPDNDLSWIDMDDFVELDWVLPTELNPETKILPLGYAPRLTYFRQTDIGGIISGDPDRTSPFGAEPTHFCIMSHDDDPRRVQAQLISERLDQLNLQMESHLRSTGETELRVIQDGHQDASLNAEFEALRRHSGVLYEKKTFLENMLSQMTTRTPSDSQILQADGNRDKCDTSVELGEGSMAIPSGAEFESDFNNRFVVHNMQLKWSNLLRNIVLRYIHQVSQRRGFVYYLSRPAVKFILDIVDEQMKARSTKPARTAAAAAAAPATASTMASPDPSVSERGISQDIEDKIRKILQDGRNFVNADEAMDGDPCAVPIEDLSNGIGDEFTPQNSYHVRLIAPQIQLQSDKNLKHVVLVTAKGMELKVVEVMDKARMSDVVSGLVQRRFLVNMDSTQFFVTHQKWFSTALVSMYAGSRYGTPSGSSWPPWVPMEVVFDFQTDPFGFKRVVQKTSAQLRYDKYNTLRLKYNDEVNSEGNVTSQDNQESRMDNLWVEFPSARALCNSSQYYAMYVIVLDLLMYSEPLEKTRSERLEKIMLASDFSDLSGAPEMVQKLQERIRQLEEIKTHFQIYSKYLDKRGWEDRLLLERDLAACEDELFFMMKAITTSQRKYDTTSQSNALLKWSISARDIVWHLIKDTNEPLVELQLKDVEYDRTDNADGSHINLIRVGKILGLNLLPDATYPQIIAPYVDGDRGTGIDVGNRQMIRVYWNMLEAIAGIPVMDHFEVNLFPMKIQLEREVGKRLFEYIFPGIDGDGGAGAAKNDSPFMLKQNMGGQAEDEDDDESMASSTGRVADERPSSFSTRPGSLELRLHPTLTSHSNRNGSSPRKAASVHNGEGHSFRLFRSTATSRPPSKKPSHESLRSSNTARPGAVGRTPTGLSSKDGHGPGSAAASESKKVSRFALRNKSNADDKQQPSDDLTKMIARASNYMTFAYIKMPSVVLCLSYKGKDNRNFEDVHDLVFRMPTIEWRNKTWSNLDLALALKKAVVKALISHTGAIIGNKFSRHRPNTAQTSKLRELASSSAIIAATPSSSASASFVQYHQQQLQQQQQQQQQQHQRQQQYYAESVNNSDDSSSLYGTSPVDFSRSPPRSLHGSSHSSIPLPRSSSRSSSVASSRSYRTGGSGATGGGGGGGGGGAPVPGFLMMTPPTPHDQSTPHGLGLGVLLGRPASRSSLTPLDGGSSRPTSSASTLEPERRRSAGSGFLRDKLSTLTHRMSRQGSAIKDDEDGAAATAAAAAAAAAAATAAGHGGGESTPENGARPKRMSWAPGRIRTG